MKFAWRRVHDISITTVHAHWYGAGVATKNRRAAVGFSCGSIANANNVKL